MSDKKRHEYKSIKFDKREEEIDKDVSKKTSPAGSPIKDQDIEVSVKLTPLHNPADSNQPSGVVEMSPRLSSTSFIVVNVLKVNPPTYNDPYFDTNYTVR